jgi:3-dehydroquinate synthetase
MDADILIYKETELAFELNKRRQVFVLVDENTRKYCLPKFEERFGNCFEILEVASGEKNKNIESVMNVWRALFDRQADRQALLINLGGGMISDLGGFAASCYQRGIDFVNVPTTLLAMVDAAIGGKTGIDFEGFKNQIGTFSLPLGVFVSLDFLKSLPERHKRSGLAELIKYGFISDMDFLNINEDNFVSYIAKAAKIKYEIAAADPKEKGQRKSLNFGHTIGHAMESHYMSTPMALQHGEAVALGMYAAIWLSIKYCGLAPIVLQHYEDIYRKVFGAIEVDIMDADIDGIVINLAHDKKNKNGKPQFVLISDLGKVELDVLVQTDDVVEALHSLQSFLIR